MRFVITAHNLLLPLTLFMLRGSPLSAQEWTRFRGPNGSGMGTAPGVPAVPSQADFNWKVELPGSGHSSPVVWGGRVFVTATPKDSSVRMLVCIDAQKGTTLWAREYGGAAYRFHADNSYSASSPAVDDKRVYLHWASPEGSGLAALDQADGHELWRKELGPFVSQHGPGASPIVFEDLVILNFDQDQPKSFLVAFDRATGAERWRFDHEGASSSASTPCIHTPQGGNPEVILTSRTRGMTAVDARNGTLRWELPELMSKRCVASPVMTESGLVIGQCGEGRSESFVYAVRPGSKEGPAQKVYEVIRSGGYVPTPLAAGELLFLWKENGLVTCVEASSGKQLWSERVDGPFYGSPVCVNGLLYNMTVRGDLVVVAADKTFRQVGRVALGEGSHASGAVSGGRLYLRTFTHLISVGK